jgi:predicted ATPase
MKHGFAFWQNMGNILKNYALMEQGDETALMNMEQTLSNMRKSGMQLWISNPMCVMAEAFGKQENFEKAFYYLNEAWTLVEKTGEYFYWSELHRVKGFLQEKSGKTNSAEKLYLEAKAIAARQGAKYFELRVTIDLAQLWCKNGKRADAIKMMKDVLKKFDETDETVDVVKGKEVLQELESSEARPRVISK